MNEHGCILPPEVEAELRAAVATGKPGTITIDYAAFTIVKAYIGHAIHWDRPGNGTRGGGRVERG